MVASDLQEAKRHALLKANWYEVKVSADLEWEENKSQPVPE